MSVNSVSLGFADANKLLRVEYTSCPTFVRKIACFFFATSWLAAALPSPVVLTMLLAVKKHFHPLNISTERFTFNIELANTSKQSTRVSAGHLLRHNTQRCPKTMHYRVWVEERPILVAKNVIFCYSIWMRKTTRHTQHFRFNTTLLQQCTLDTNTICNYRVLNILQTLLYRGTLMHQS